MTGRPADMQRPSYWTLQSSDEGPGIVAGFQAQHDSSGHLLPMSTYKQVLRGNGSGAPDGSFKIWGVAFGSKMSNKMG
jgi:hypothetical protein